MKRPKDSPTKEGQRVIWRGRGALGTVQKMDERGWVWVAWDEGMNAPRVCHQNELALPFEDKGHQW